MYRRKGAISGGRAYALQLLPRLDDIQRVGGGGGGASCYTPRDQLHQQPLVPVGRPQRALAALVRREVDRGVRHVHQQLQKSRKPAGCQSPLVWAATGDMMVSQCMSARVLTLRQGQTHCPNADDDMPSMVVSHVPH